MSHAATNWAIQQRGLKPATKIVLWHLCDRHNPDFGCFPTQVRLAEDAEMSVSALNEHLIKLEERRLIHRVRTHDPRTHKRQATRYILGFEPDFPQDPSPESGDGDEGPEDEPGGDPTPDSGHESISEFSAKPSPDFAESHLRNPETKPVREPLREPVKEGEDAQARDDRFEAFFGELLDALGLDLEAALPAWWQGWPAREHVRRWITDLALTEDRIVAVARDSRNAHPEPPDGPRALDRLMERAARSASGSVGSKANGSTGDQRRTRESKPADTPRASLDEIASFYAGMVNGDGYLPSNAISNTVRNAMLERGLVTAQRLRERGVL